VPTITGTQLAQDAFGLLNVFLPGEALPANDGARALRLLNLMLSQWRNRRIFIPIIKRERFDLVANQGGPTNPYTIGDGGDFDTERPPNQNSIVLANLILTASSPEVRVQLGLYTNDAYNSNALPSMSNTQPTGLYYNPTYADELGSVFLWPVPTTNENDLELFIQKPLVSFANLTTEYDLPDGADDALTYNLARRLAGPYGRQMSAEDRLLARESVGAFTRSNVQLSDLSSDAYWATYARRSLYNINTGNG
jgi:hypothetical protein